MSVRARSTVATVADLVPAPRGTDRVLVAIDGPDAAGKTTFAAALAASLRSAGRPVVQIAVDDFHQPRAVRYRRGRDSPRGFWLDAFDYALLGRLVLDPLGPGGSGRYRGRGRDLATDADVDEPWSTAPPGAVVVVDGLFLHRHELVRRWDFSVYLDVPESVTTQRMATRDGLPPDRMRRYLAAQRLYRAACDPARRASVVIDNSDAVRPRIVRSHGGAPR